VKTKVQGDRICCRDSDRPIIDFNTSYDEWNVTWLYSNVSGSKSVQPTRAAQDNVSVMSAEVRAKIEIEILRTFLSSKL
jgi:hypothetical protein